jgi:hypothetical protein
MCKSDSAGVREYEYSVYLAVTQSSTSFKFEYQLIFISLGGISRDKIIE